MNDRPPARLRWRCRRGTRELELVLLGFIERQFATLTAEEQRLLDALLDTQDPELSDWLLGGQTPKDHGMARIVARILSAA